jgi:hypothetical protein
MYIDPGAGSLAFQLLLSAGVGAVYTFRRGIARVLGVFRRHRGDETVTMRKERESAGVDGESPRDELTSRK